MLTQYHDRILMRYVGKVRTELGDQMLNDLNQGKMALSNSFVQLYDEKMIEQESWLHALPVFSQILEYQEQLEHLDHLVDSFFHFHKNDNEVKLEDTH